MEANLCLLTRHSPAMHYRRNVRVHSSVHLPALQAKVGPLPGAGRLAVVGAGVVLSCALGAMYLKGARAVQLPMHRSSQTSYQGGNGGEPRGTDLMNNLHELLPEICDRKLDSKPQQLTDLMKQCLIEKAVNNFSKNKDLTNLIEENLNKTNPGEHDYNLGLVLVLALISEKKYVEALEICNWLNSEPIAVPLDARPHLLAAIVNMMMARESIMARESMLQLTENNTSTVDLEIKKLIKLAQEAWEKYDSLQERRPTISN